MICKKMLALGTSLLMTVCAFSINNCAYAWEDRLQCVVSNENAEISFSYAPDVSSDEKMSFIIYYPKTDSGDRSVYDFGEISISEDGKYAYQSTFSDDDLSGNYDILVYTKDFSQEKTVSYVNVLALKKINEAKNNVEVCSIIGKLYRPLGLDISLYNYFTQDTDKLNIADYIIAKRQTGYENIEALCREYKDAIAIEKISVSTESSFEENLKSAEEVLSYDFTSSKSDFSKLTQDAKERLLSLIKSKNYLSKESFNEEYKKDCLLAFINTTKWPDVLDIKKLDSFSLLNFNSDNMDNYKRLVLRRNEVNSIEKANEIFNLIIPQNGGTSTGSSSSTGTSGSYSNVSAPASKEPKAEEIVNKNTFDDIEDCKWAMDAIKYLSENKVISGDGNGKFRPNDNVTKEEFVKMAVSCFKLEKGLKNIEFSDVADDAWYSDSVKIAASLEIVKGIDDNSFGIGTDISRQDTAVIIKRIVDYLNIEFKDKTQEITINDKQNISDYATESVDFLVKNGIIHGFEDSSFRPFDKLTRAQSAKILYDLVCNR